MGLRDAELRVLINGWEWADRSASRPTGADILPHLIVICHACEHRQAVCAGPCACKLSRLDIIDHATKGECPAGKFEGVNADSPAPPRPPPPPMTAEEIALGEANAAICEGCADQCKGVTRTREWAGKQWPVYVTSCKLGGCAGISLTVKGWCPAGKW